MSNLSINSEIRITLDGKSYNAHVDWEDTNITASYESDQMEPQLAVDNFTFVLEAREAILQWIADDFIFEGMPFDITIFNNQPVEKTFKSLLDFTNGYTNLINDGELQVGTLKDDGTETFLDQISGMTFAYLESLGLVGPSDYIDVDYVVEKKFNLMEILSTSIVIYIMAKEAAEAVKRTSDDLAQVASIAISGATGPIAATVLAVAKAVLNLIYTAILLLTLIELARNLINTLVPPKRTHKAIMLKRALEVICTKMGYGFETSITELDSVAYLPSNPNLDEKTAFGFISVTKGTPKGIPDIDDFGYNCREMFELAKTLFRAVIAIQDNVVQFRPANDPYWIRTALFDYNSKDPRLESQTFNTGELRGNRVLSFQTDFNDEWTIDNYKGTAYEIRTEPITVRNENAVLIKGNEEIDFGVALGNRKDRLNAIESLLLVAASLIDNVTKVLGGGTRFAKQIKSKIGVLKQSNNYHSIPKVLFLKGGKLPTNHRDLWNARILYEKYHSNDSFVLGNGFAQKKVYNDVTIPFGFEDYKVLTLNPYFNFNGLTAKIINFDWTVGEDEAVVSFWVREQYTKNLKEIYFEPE